MSVHSRSFRAVLCALVLAGGCREEPGAGGHSVEQVREPRVSEAHSVERMPLTEEEQEAVQVARQLAERRGMSTRRLPDVTVTREGPNWEVGFTELRPNRIGGPGFAIVFDAKTNKLVKVLLFQ